MKLNAHVTTQVSTSTRARQVSSMFDVPPAEKCELSWKGDVPIETFDWNVGLIVGPSGSGKSTIAKSLFGEAAPLTWGGASVIDTLGYDGRSANGIRHDRPELYSGVR